MQASATLKNFRDTGSIRDPRIVVAITWIERQPAKRDVDINEIAQTVNLSSSYFRHLFREQTGLTLHRYHKFLRLQRAHDLLCQSFLSVKQVMSEVGWTDESHFCRDYKRVYGSSPSQARSGISQISTKQPELAKESQIRQ
jgi:transcriptional regulator GlxA family with amidase domain